MSVERQEDFLGEDFLWERQRQEEEGERQEENGLSERQIEEEKVERQIEEKEEKRVTETAFLVTRTNQQALALIMVGQIIIG